eukprot:695304_1
MSMLIISQCNAKDCTMGVWYRAQRFRVAFRYDWPMSKIQANVKAAVGASVAPSLFKDGIELPTGTTTASDAGLLDNDEVDAEDADTVPYFDIGSGKENDPNEATLLLSLLTALSISIGINVGLCVYLGCKRIESKKK